MSRRALAVLCKTYEEAELPMARDFPEPPIAGLALPLVDLWLQGNAPKATE